MQKTVNVLSDTGMTVVEDRPEGIEQTFGIFNSLLSADGGTAVETLLRMVGTIEMHPWTKALLGFCRGVTMTTAEFGGLMLQWERFCSSMLSFMEKHDEIICPVCAFPALHHEVSLDLKKIPAFSYTMTYNLTGWLGVVVRAGTSPEGLPIGVQVMAHPWREDVVLTVAQHIETVSRGWQCPSI
ncbi:hypothetical protein GTO27_12205 [Candidatus Bathyarchaeota archaeon]|nr:hypothetical protein [Candidatus Bathyarchaeota archaeon]